MTNSTEDVLNWVLSDHLGSSSVTAQADGTWNSEIRYSAFGETRYSSGITPTDYRYTGQMLDKDLGLYYYVSRWYDPSLGRFIQADTIVPNPSNPKSYDRYAYVNNNPLKFGDPTGHFGMVPLGPDLTPQAITSFTNKEAGSYGIQYTGEKLNLAQKWITIRAASDIGDALVRNGASGTKYDAFKKLTGGTLIYNFTNDVSDGWGRAKFINEGVNSKQINIQSFHTVYGWANANVVMTHLLVHEVGHVISARYGLSGSYAFQYGDGVTTGMETIRGLSPVGSYKLGYRTENGPEQRMLWQQNTKNPDELLGGTVEFMDEQFANSFVGWVYDSWALDPSSGLGGSEVDYQAGIIRENTINCVMSDVIN